MGCWRCFGLVMLANDALGKSQGGDCSNENGRKYPKGRSWRRRGVRKVWSRQRGSCGHPDRVWWGAGGSDKDPIQRATATDAPGDIATGELMELVLVVRA